MGNFKIGTILSTFEIFSQHFSKVVIKSGVDGLGVLAFEEDFIGGFDVRVPVPAFRV